MKFPNHVSLDVKNSLTANSTYYWARAYLTTLKLNKNFSEKLAFYKKISPAKVKRFPTKNNAPLSAYHAQGLFGLKTNLSLNKLIKNQRKFTLALLYSNTSISTYKASTPNNLVTSRALVRILKPARTLMLPVTKTYYKRMRGVIPKMVSGKWTTNGKLEYLYKWTPEQKILYKSLSGTKLAEEAQRETTKEISIQTGLIKQWEIKEKTKFNDYIKSRVKERLIKKEKAAQRWLRLSIVTKSIEEPITSTIARTRTSKLWNLFNISFLKKEHIYTKLKYSRTPQYDIVSGGSAALFAGFLGFLITEKFGFELVDSGDFYCLFMYIVFFFFCSRIFFKLMSQQHSAWSIISLKWLLLYYQNILSLLIKFVKRSVFQ